MLVLIHFKGHPMGGYGGALKQLSIGCASSAGKAYIHSGGKVTDQNILWENCAEQDTFLEAMADAAATVAKHFASKIAYVAVMKNLSVDCDCCAVAEDPCMDDVGILSSLDPVALDRAPEGVLSVAIFDDRDIAKIHADFMNKPDPTDVITFEGDPSDPEEAGEICISADTARSNAAKFSNTFSRELSLYVAHGYLHLAGVDDISETDAKVMRRAETLALAIHDKHFKKPIFTFND